MKQALEGRSLAMKNTKIKFFYLINKISIKNLFSLFFRVRYKFVYAAITSRIKRKGI